jgi:moderate conductance mechanosensitive channel
MKDTAGVILRGLHQRVQDLLSKIHVAWRWLFQHQVSIRILISTVLVGLLTVAFLTLWIPTVTGRVPIVRVWQQQLQQADRSVERRGSIETKPIWFDGEKLFTIASPTVWDRSQPGQLFPIEMRAEQIEANLNRVIEGSFISGENSDGILTNFDPETLQVSVVWLNDIPLITASDSFHSQPLKLVTITYLDAGYNGQPPAVLAEQWRSILYQHLYTALMARSPQALGIRGALGESLLVLGLTLVISGLLWLLQAPLRWENQRLRTQQATLMGDLATDESVQSGRTIDLAELQRQFLASFQQYQRLQYQRSGAGFFRWLLAWGQIAVWMTGVIAALLIFPWTKPWGWWLLGIPTGLLSLWFFTSSLNRLAGALLQGAAESWVRFGSSHAYPQRDALRIFTIFSALKPAKTFLIYGLGLIATLAYLGIPLTLIWMVAGVVGLAALLIGQSFVKDWLMGSLILWEDQYVIGDVIATQGHTGLVERMNLRCTQLRHPAGRLISLANGTITQVDNLTRHRSAAHPLVEKSVENGQAVQPSPVHAGETTGAAPLSEGPMQS